MRSDWEDSGFRRLWLPLACQDTRQDTLLHEHQSQFPSILSRFELHPWIVYSEIGQELLYMDFLSNSLTCLTSSTDFENHLGHLCLPCWSCSCYWQACSNWWIIFDPLPLHSLWSHSLRHMQRGHIPPSHWDWILRWSELFRPFDWIWHQTPFDAWPSRRTWTSDLQRPADQVHRRHRQAAEASFILPVWAFVRDRWLCIVPSLGSWSFVLDLRVFRFSTSCLDHSLRKCSNSEDYLWLIDIHIGFLIVESMFRCHKKTSPLMVEQECLSSLHSNWRGLAEKSGFERNPWYPQADFGFWVFVFWSSFPLWSSPNMPTRIRRSSSRSTQPAFVATYWYVSAWSCAQYQPTAWCTQIFLCYSSHQCSLLGSPDNCWWSSRVGLHLFQFSHWVRSCWCFQRGWWWSCSGSPLSQSSKPDEEACSLRLVCMERMWCSVIQLNCSPKGQLDLSHTQGAAWQSRVYSRLWPDEELIVRACSSCLGSAALSSPALDDTECECTCSSSWMCWSLSPRSAQVSASMSLASRGFLRIVWVAQWFCNTTSYYSSWNWYAVPFHSLDFGYLHWTPFPTNTWESQQSQYQLCSQLWSAAMAFRPHRHSTWDSWPNLEVFVICNNHFDWTDTFDRSLSTSQYSYSSHNCDISEPIQLPTVICDAAALHLFEALLQTWFGSDWVYVAIVDVWMPWVRSYLGFCCHVMHLWKRRSWLNS